MYLKGNKYINELGVGKDFLKRSQKSTNHKGKE